MPNIDKMQIGGETYNITIPAGLSEQEQAQIRENIGAISAGSTVVQNGTYPEMTVGNATHASNADHATIANNATNAINDGAGNNIANTYVKTANFGRSILEEIYPIGSVYYGETSPASQIGGTWTKETHAGKISTSVINGPETAIPTQSLSSLYTLTIPANTHAIVSAVLYAVPSDSSNIMALYAYINGQIRATVRTTLSAGGGCSMTQGIDSAPTQQTISFSAYNYLSQTERYSVFISATFIQDQTAWRRTA